MTILSPDPLSLCEADAGRLDRMDRLAFGQADIVAYSQVVEQGLDKGELLLAGYLFP